MTPLLYTPATIGFIRKEAENGRSADEIAEMIGWSRVELDRRCGPYQINFSAVKPLPEAKADVGFKRSPGPPPGTNRFSRTDDISFRVPPHIGEQLRRGAEREGVPLSRYCGDIISRAIEAERGS